MFARRSMAIISNVRRNIHSMPHRCDHSAWRTRAHACVCVRASRRHRRSRQIIDGSGSNHALRGYRNRRNGRCGAGAHRKTSRHSTRAYVVTSSRHIVMSRAGNVRSSRQHGGYSLLLSDGASRIQSSSFLKFRLLQQIVVQQCDRSINFEAASTFKARALSSRETVEYEARINRPKPKLEPIGQRRNDIGLAEPQACIEHLPGSTPDCSSGELTTASGRLTSDPLLTYNETRSDIIPGHRHAID